MSRPFILRPIATTLLMVAIVLLGALGYRQLPVAALPNVDFPTIQVTTVYPGAGPEVIEATVTAPLENYLGRISDLISMNSTSSYGFSQITLQFALSRRIDVAAQDVQAALAAAEGWLPIDKLPSPPIYRQINPADTPVLVLALTSASLPIYEINDLALTTIVQKLSQVSGVGSVTVQGGQSRAVRLQINPVKLAGHGLTLEDVRRAIAAATNNSPKGGLDGERQAYQIGANDQLFTAQAYHNVILAYRGGAAITLRDVGEAVDGIENSEIAAWLNGQRAVIIEVQRQPGANTIAVVDAVQALLPNLATLLPQDLKISIVADRTPTIRAAVVDVQFTLVLTIVLVVLVVFLFLRKFWATLIPSIAIPISIIATFGGMAIAGFSLNTLSLMALTIAVGFVVDDAIVMLENIVRHLENGEAPLAAALKGARQIGFTVISLTVSLIATFVPLLLMDGVIGRLFREFAVTLCLAIAVSGLVSLTLTPMMCAALLKSEDASSKHPTRHSGFWFRLERFSAGIFDAVLALYAASLRVVLRHRRVTLLTVVLTVGATGFLWVKIPKGFLPLQDTGFLVGVTQADPDISFSAMAERQKALVALLAQDRAVRAISSQVGVSLTNVTLNRGRVYLDIGLPDHRKETISEVAERLQRLADNVGGLNFVLKPVQDFQVDARASSTQYQVVLQGLDQNEVLENTQRLVKTMRQNALLEDVGSTELDKGQQLYLTIDRDAAARLGVNVAEVNQTLYNAFGQRQVASVFAPFNRYYVVLEIDPAFRNSPDVLDKIHVTGSGSRGADAEERIGPVFSRNTPMVPLSAFTRIQQNRVPLTIMHQGLFPAASVSFNLAAGVSLGKGLAAVESALAETGLPGTITSSFTGTAAEFKASRTREPLLILFAIITVYIVLGVLYESYIHPLTILSTLPSAGLGALLALVVMGRELDLVALIGIVLLIGIVKKNAIMMVDFALSAERSEGMTPDDAIYQACLLRFRPIMMTTMAALLGALPLAFSTGIGFELRQPLGIVVVGGLIVSQILTLYTTPVIYLAFSRFQKNPKVTWRKKRQMDDPDYRQPEAVAPSMTRPDRSLSP